MELDRFHGKWNMSKCLSNRFMRKLDGKVPILFTDIVSFGGRVM